MGFAEWLAIGLFVVGIPVTWLLARRNRQRPDLRYVINQEELIAPEDSLLSGGLEIRFRGSALEQLCRTYVGIWSKRGDTIRNHDLTDADPLRLELPATDVVLSARIVTMSRAQIQPVARVGPSDSVVELTFDFLDPHDGFIVEVLHRENATPALLGTIKGCDVKQVRNVDLRPATRERARLPYLRRLADTYRGRTPLLVMFGLFVILSVVGITLGLSDWNIRPMLGFAELPPKSSQEEAFSDVLMWVTFLPPIVVMLFAFLMPARRRIPIAILTIDHQASFDWSPGVPHAEFPGGMLKVDSRVFHPNFGIGSVTAITGESNNAVANVDFDSVGTKKLLIRIAPLTPAE